MFGFICRYRSTAISTVMIGEKLLKQPPSIAKAFGKVHVILLSVLSNTYASSGKLIAPEIKSDTLRQIIRKLDVFCVTCFVAVIAAIKVTFRMTINGEIVKISDANICVFGYVARIVLRKIHSVELVSFITKNIPFFDSFLLRIFRLLEF